MRRLGLRLAAADQSGKLSPLPAQPLTVFGVGEQTFTTSASNLDAAVDSLAALEGGAAPLYRALDGAVDFVDANAPAGRRTVLVVTAGVDDACGTANACRDAVRALIVKCPGSGVAIDIVAIAGSVAAELTRLTEATRGVALWTDDPAALGAGMQ